MGLSDGIQPIEASYAEGSPWPPRAFNSLTLRSSEFSTVFGAEHDADGTHNHPLIAHAGAVLHQYGGGWVAREEGLTLSRVGVGVIRIDLWTPMRSSLEWGVIAHIQRWAVSGWVGAAGVVAELPSFGAQSKTDMTTWIRCADAAEAKLYDPVSLVIHAYGRRRMT